MSKDVKSTPFLDISGIETSRPIISSQTSFRSGSNLWQATFMMYDRLSRGDISILEAGVGSGSYFGNLYFAYGSLFWGWVKLMLIVDGMPELSLLHSSSILLSISWLSLSLLRITLLEEQITFACDTMSVSLFVSASLLILSLFFKSLGRFRISFLFVHFFPGN